jgi:hypothetical protein
LKSQGIAEFEQHHDVAAHQAFSRARELFVQEGNETMVAVVDVWRGRLLIRQNQFAEGGKVSRQSAEVFERQNLAVRAANARLWSARSLQELNETGLAVAEAQRALQELEGFHAPWISYRALNTLGKLREAAGERDQAEALYLRAISELELLRGNIKLDELRMSFGKDKYEVYENVVSINMRKEMRLPRFSSSNDPNQNIDRPDGTGCRNCMGRWETSLTVETDSKVREELNICIPVSTNSGRRDG